MLESRSKSSPTAVAARADAATPWRAEPVGNVLGADAGRGKLLIGGNFDHGDAVRQYQKR